MIYDLFLNFSQESWSVISFTKIKFLFYHFIIKNLLDKNLPRLVNKLNLNYSSFDFCYLFDKTGQKKVSLNF